MKHFISSASKWPFVTGIFLIGLWINYIDLVLVPLDFEQCYALNFDKPSERFLSPEHPATWTMRQHVTYGMNAVNRWNVVMNTFFVTLPACLMFLSKKKFWKVGFFISLVVLLFIFRSYIFPDFEHNLHHDCDRKGAMSGFVLIFTLIYLPMSFALLGFIKLVQNAIMRD